MSEPSNEELELCFYLLTKAMQGEFCSPFYADLLDKLHEKKTLTDRQIAYILGELAPNGFKTLQKKLGIYSVPLNDIEYVRKTLRRGIGNG